MYRRTAGQRWRGNWGIITYREQGSQTLIGLVNKWACGHGAERVGVGMYILDSEEENEALLVWRNYNAAPRVGGWWRRSGTRRMTPAVFHSSLLLQPTCTFQVSNFIIHVLEGLLHDLKLRLGLSSRSNPARTWMKLLCMNFHAILW